jgi:hypothetical protein
MQSETAPARLNATFPLFPEQQSAAEDKKTPSDRRALRLKATGVPMLRMCGMVGGFGRKMREIGDGGVGGNGPPRSVCSAFIEPMKKLLRGSGKSFSCS